MRDRDAVAVSAESTHQDTGDKRFIVYNENARLKRQNGRLGGLLRCNLYRLLFLADGQADEEAGSLPRLALDLDGSAVPLHDSPGDSKAEAGSLDAARREEGIEDTGDDFRRHSGSGIRHLDFDLMRAVRTGVQRER